MYVARVYVGGMMPTVENIEVADTDWVEANSRSVKIMYSSRTAAAKRSAWAPAHGSPTGKTRH